MIYSSDDFKRINGVTGTNLISVPITTIQRKELIFADNNRKQKPKLNLSTEML